MSTALPAPKSMTQLIIQQDAIDSFESTGRVFLQRVLGLSWDDVLVTDLSELSDFRFRGDFDADVATPYKELCRSWNSWVLSKVRAEYPFLGDISVHIKLRDLFWRIETENRQLH